MGRILDYLRPLIGSAMRQLGLGRAEAWVVDYLGLSSHYPWSTMPERQQAVGHARVNIAATHAFLTGQSNTIGGGFPPGRLTSDERVGIRLKVTVKSPNGTMRIRNVTANVPQSWNMDQLFERLKVWFDSEMKDRWYDSDTSGQLAAMGVYQVLEGSTPNAAINE